MSAIPLADLPGRPCPIAAALGLVGERWALLVVRELALGNTRFEDIVRGTGGPRDQVTARLKALRQAGELLRAVR
jgi:DNA-binding HxlR family transcriptional regulator